MTPRIKRLLESSEEPIAVVTPVNSNGVNFTRALRAEGVTAIGVFGEPPGLYQYTNSCEKVFCSDVNGDPLMRTLEEIGRTARTKPALIPIGDLQVILFSQHRELLNEYFLLNIPPADTISTLMDKTELYRWGHDRYPFPKTYRVESLSDLEAAIGRLQFPVVFKPRYRSKAWLRSALPKASFFTDGESLVAFYSQASAIEPVFLISEFVEGPDSNIWVSHFYYSDGEPLAYYTDQKVRQWPHLLGTGSYCLSVKNKEIVDQTKSMLAELDYAGIGSMEFKRDERTGQYKVIEPCCGRPCFHSYISRGEGINLPYLVYCHLTGRPLPRCDQTGKVFAFLDEEADLRSAYGYLREKKLSLKQYVRDLLRVRFCVNCTFRDPLVGLGFTIRLARTVTLGFLRKLSRVLFPKLGTTRSSDSVVR